MVLTIVLYLINGLLYSITVYFTLYLLERAGKRDPGTRVQRADLAARWAAGFTLLQICADSIIFAG